jgi:hypothetical protein
VLLGVAIRKLQTVILFQCTVTPLKGKIMYPSPQKLAILSVIRRVFKWNIFEAPRIKFAESN